MRTLLLLLLFGVMACEPAQRPEDAPGAPGAGLKDPRESAPSALSYIQKKVYNDMRAPFQVKANGHGGLDWYYKSQRGSVFGEKVSVVIYSFDDKGILKDRREDVIKQLGKAE